MSADEIAVLEANDAFYDAFHRRDVAAMDALWATDVPVTCVHPGWDPIRGRDEVMASWQRVLLGDAPDVRASRASAHVAGDAAWVVCREQIPNGPPLAATNLFVRRDGAWKMCHHHAGLVARPDDERLPAALA